MSNSAPLGRFKVRRALGFSILERRYVSLQRNRALECEKSVTGHMRGSCGYPEITGEDMGANAAILSMTIN